MKFYCENLQTFFQNIPKYTKTFFKTHPKLPTKKVNTPENFDFHSLKNTIINSITQQIIQHQHKRTDIKSAPTNWRIWQSSLKELRPQQIFFQTA